MNTVARVSLRQGLGFTAILIGVFAAAAVAAEPAGIHGPVSPAVAPFSALHRWCLARLFLDDGQRWVASVAAAGLDRVAPTAPWRALAANSEQRQPVYLGRSPRELALGAAATGGGRWPLPAPLREVGEAHLRAIAAVLAERHLLPPSPASVEALPRAAVRLAASSAPGLVIEGWPVRDDYGQLSWVWARWRLGGIEPDGLRLADRAAAPTQSPPPAVGSAAGRWRWLSAEWLPAPVDPKSTRAPLLPEPVDLRRPGDFARVFADVLTLADLYDKPRFGDTVWTTGEGDDDEVLEAWPSVGRLAAWRDFLGNVLPLLVRAPGCRILPQPARVDDRPISVQVTVIGNRVEWPVVIDWQPVPDDLPARPSLRARRADWPPDFQQRYRRDVQTLSGEREAVLPITGRRVRFVRKNSIERDNQLQDLVTWLEEWYRVRGIATRRQDFVWRGLKQTNLIAVLPGTDPLARPVLLGDHIDTAFCEEVFAAGNVREAAPGADDNYSATAALLRAAEVLPARRLRHPVWLCHFTGEEFPADDLGARHFVSRLLQTGDDIEGLVLMDLIGHRPPGGRIFQINPGRSAASRRMARVALDLARARGRYRPVLRSRYDERSYLYNTDGLIFCEHGFPVVFINEHMNKFENLDRIGYHHRSDTSRLMDFDYATHLAKVAIDTAAVLAAGR